MDKLLLHQIPSSLLDNIISFMPTIEQSSLQTSVTYCVKDLGWVRPNSIRVIDCQNEYQTYSFSSLEMFTIVPEKLGNYLWRDYNERMRQYCILQRVIWTYIDKIDFYEELLTDHWYGKQFYLLLD